MNMHVHTPIAAQNFGFCLAHLRGSKSRAHEYKSWALEAEKHGNIEAYRKYRKWSENAWLDAKWALDQCRYWKGRVQ